MADSGSGFSAAQRLVDLAEAVRAVPELPRAELVALLARHGERPGDLTAEVFSEADAAALRAAARRMGEVLGESGEDRAARALNALFEEYATCPRLTRHDGHPWHLHVDRGRGPAGTAGSWPRARWCWPGCSPCTGGSPGAPAPPRGVAGTFWVPGPAVPAATAPTPVPRGPGSPPTGAGSAPKGRTDGGFRSIGNLPA